ncbi:hypothetical protein TNIN_199481 [Trichonephila inaurata madagascariensis]|uniref:Uncharacterized protein n=1 Tax=Trichonephila inaurata madagascariensis TaxID=2747483 RepID=A0A8X6XRU9_9ARAC|nr:hypothetical protein TNIN_199481 [Trichonephila inaurata madagascariensis]
MSGCLLLQYIPEHGSALDIRCCPAADERRNLKQPHVNLNRVVTPDHYACCTGSVSRYSGGEVVPFTWRLHTHAWLSFVPKTNRHSSLNNTFCQTVAFNVPLAWHRSRWSRRCFGVKGSVRLDCRFA